MQVSSPHSQTNCASSSRSPNESLMPRTRSFTSRKRVSFRPILRSRSSIAGECRLGPSWGDAASDRAGGAGALLFSGEESAMAMIESRDRATSDPEARRRVLGEIKERGVEYLLLWFTDLEGH